MTKWADLADDASLQAARAALKKNGIDAFITETGRGQGMSGRRVSFFSPPPAAALSR